MLDRFIRVCAATPKIRVADTAYNLSVIEEMLTEAKEKGVSLTVFPELCLCGYTCSDLFWQESLIRSCLETLSELEAFCKKEVPGMVVAVGLPLAFRDRLYNVAAIIADGTLAGFVPKSALPAYGEFYETRHFSSGCGVTGEVTLPDGRKIPFGTDLIFACREIPEFTFAAEICEDLWIPMPPSVRHTAHGAHVIINLSASDAVTGKEEYRRDLVKGQSARLLCGYVYASAGEGESTQDLVFSGHNLIAENGRLLSESRVRYSHGAVYADLDLEAISHDRRRMTTYFCGTDSPEGMKEGKEDAYRRISFSLKPFELQELLRRIDPHPFVPDDHGRRQRRCENIIGIQAMGLKKRLEHTGSKCAVIGLSGGLDSTLALLITARAFDALGKDRSGILAVTMPCFGTTDRTYQNACNLAKHLKVTLKEVDLKESVLLHFRDIGQDPEVHDVTYENSQARERTQVLMDLANKYNGMVIGTGDLSELALGWATYNGDHMSMYGVNASVPKTLVRYLVGYFADEYEKSGEAEAARVLRDVLDTPVSPELLPPTEGEISQKTEDLVGPYELHDFFLYYVLRFGFGPKKILRLAKLAFAGEYEEKVIKKWLNTFYRRFFAQQFKRSCLPDGPKVGTVSVSPRGDLRMPSDACMTVWKKELEWD